MTAYRLDVPELYARIDSKRRQEGRTWRDLARELDMSASLFSRMAAGHAPDAHALITLLAWLDLSAEYVTQPKDPTP